MSSEETSETQQPTRQDLLTCTTEVVARFCANNKLPAEALPILMKETFDALDRIASGSGAGDADELRPAVSIKKSVRPDHLVCLEDGRSFKTLKRHLGSEHGMTPKEYRDKWGLPSDYPMVAPNYSERRRAVAKSIGLGRSGNS